MADHMNKIADKTNETIRKAFDGAAKVQPKKTYEDGWREACEAMAELHDNLATRPGPSIGRRAAHKESAADCRQMAQDGPDKRGTG